MDEQHDKVIIVEGLTDKKQIEKVINENVTIICTHGTFSIERFDNLLEEYDLDNREVYIFVDEDKSGIELRKELTSELPHATQIYTDEEYKEVAATPVNILAAILNNHNIAINRFYLQL